MSEFKRLVGGALLTAVKLEFGEDASVEYLNQGWRCVKCNYGAQSSRECEGHFEVFVHGDILATWTTAEYLKRQQIAERVMAQRLACINWDRVVDNAYASLYHRTACSSEMAGVDMWAALRDPQTFVHIADVYRVMEEDDKLRFEQWLRKATFPVVWDGSMRRKKE